MSNVSRAVCTGEESQVKEMRVQTIEARHKARSVWKKSQLLASDEWIEDKARRIAAAKRGNAKAKREEREREATVQKEAPSRRHSNSPHSPVAIL
jgi:hypothetical protein